MRAIRPLVIVAPSARASSPAIPGLVALLLASAACGDSGSEPTRSVEAGAEAPEAPGSAPGLAPGAAAPGLGTSGAVADLFEDEVQIGGSCASTVAAETFTSAVCSCEDTSVAGFLRTRSFRSASGDTSADQLGGSVGVNRNYITAGYADIGGSFSVAGDRDIGFGGYLRAGEDVRANPALQVAGVVDVGRDAFLKSDARVFGRVGIGRDLVLEAGADINGIAVVDVGGQRLTQPVEVAPPCGCAPQQIIDVAALVDGAESDNDNAAAGLDPDDLNGIVGIGAEASLEQGRYFIHQLGGVGSLTLHIAGKVALFVADDVVATGLFRVELEPEAELDVFVKDNLVVTGAASFGDPARPRATRIYVGGSGDIAIAGASAFVGNLYAPQANVLVGGFGKVYGSLFGKNIGAAGFLDLGYDESIRDGGEDCPPIEAGDLPTIR